MEGTFLVAVRFLWLVREDGKIKPYVRMLTDTEENIAKFGEFLKSVSGVIRASVERLCYYRVEDVGNVEWLVETEKNIEKGDKSHA